jgi:acid phosphatase
MRRPCTHWFTGLYAASHNPAVYYQNLAQCPAHDVSLRALRPALDTETLPAFVFITPNMCDSMHNCSVAVGDAWLRRIIRRLTASAALSARHHGRCSSPSTRAIRTTPTLAS